MSQSKYSDLDSQFKVWCKETNRSGGVLVGSSIREFFKWLENRNDNINLKIEKEQNINKPETVL